jgi:hypothetical protein
MSQILVIYCTLLISEVGESIDMAGNHSSRNLFEVNSNKKTPPD